MTIEIVAFERLVEGIVICFGSVALTSISFAMLGAVAIRWAQTNYLYPIVKMFNTNYLEN